MSIKGLALGCWDDMPPSCPRHFVSLSVAPLVSIPPISIDQTYEVETNATLECDSLGGLGNAYGWRANTTDIPEETMETLTLTNVNASTGGIYTCVVTNAAGNDSEDTFLFIAPYFITEPVNKETTNGSSVTLLCVAEAFPSPEYQWMRMDNQSIRTNLNDSFNLLTFDLVLFGDEGDYYCTASSRNISIESRHVTVTSKSPHTPPLTVTVCHSLEVILPSLHCCIENL